MSYNSSWSASKVRKWFAGSDLLDSIVDAFLYEFLAYDDADAAMIRINGLLEAFADVPGYEWIKAEPVDGVPQILQIDSAEDMREVRNDLKKQFVPSGDDTTAYGKIVGELTNLYFQDGGTKDAKDKAYTFFFQPENVIYEKKKGQRGSHKKEQGMKTTKGWCNDFNKKLEPWSMPEVGDEGRTYVSGLDLLLLTSIVVNTNIVSKGAIDNTTHIELAEKGGEFSLYRQLQDWFTKGTNKKLAAHAINIDDTYSSDQTDPEARRLSLMKEQNVGSFFPLIDLDLEEGKRHNVRAWYKVQGEKDQWPGFVHGCPGTHIVKGKRDLGPYTDDLRFKDHPQYRKMSTTTVTRSARQGERSTTKRDKNYYNPGDNSPCANAKVELPLPANLNVVGLRTAYGLGEILSDKVRQQSGYGGSKTEALQTHINRTCAGPNYDPTSGAGAAVWDIYDAEGEKISYELAPFTVAPWAAKPKITSMSTYEGGTLYEICNMLRNLSVQPNYKGNLRPYEVADSPAGENQFENSHRLPARGDATDNGYWWHRQTGTGPTFRLWTQCNKEGPGNMPGCGPGLSGYHLLSRQVTATGVKFKKLFKETESQAWSDFDIGGGSTKFLSPASYGQNHFAGATNWVQFSWNTLSGPNSIGSLAAYTSRILARIARNYPDRVSQRLAVILKNIMTQVAMGDKERDEPEKVIKSKARPKPQEVEVKGLQPYDMQCFLIENIRRIARAKDLELNNRMFNVNKAYDNLGVIADVLAARIGDTDRRIAVYNSGKGVQPGNLISYLNHGGPSKTPETEALLGMCPDAYALLTPYIKLYRVDYLEDDTLVPYRETEIPFPTFIDPQDILQITQGSAGRYGGAGIKSFTWELVGVNPAEVENNISAQLTLRFQTLEDIFSLNSSLQAGVGAEGEAAQAGYLDLIIGSGTSFRSRPGEAPKAHPRDNKACHEILTQTYDGARFRIKVVAGWSTPPGFANMKFRNFRMPMTTGGETYGQFLEKAIRGSRVPLYLQVTGHELNFNEDGSVDLEVSYQASLTGILKAPNADIFMGGTEFDEAIKDMKKHQTEEDKKDGERLEVNKDNEDLIEDITNKKIKARKKLDKIVRRNKSAKYNRFLCNLYENSKIYMLRVKASELKRYKDLTPKARAELARRRLDETNKFGGVSDPMIATTTDIDKLILGAQKAISKVHKGKDPAGNTVSDRRYNENVLLRLQDKKGKYKSRIPEKHLKAEVLDVPYMYLGDLIDGVLSYLTNIVDDKNGLNGSFQMLLGNIEILDPLLAFQYDNALIKCGSSAAEEEVWRSLADIDPLRFKGGHRLSFYTNIGSLPISLEYFQEWFVNTIVRPQIENYSFLAFIKNLCTTLIGKAFNAKCFGDTLNYNLGFDTAIFGLADSFTSNVSTPAEVAASKAAAQERGASPLPLGTMAAPTGRKPGLQGSPPVIPSIVLYSRDSRPAVSESEYENLQNGIYHYYLGASCGLAKQIKFNKSDMPYNREARLGRRGALSAYQLRELYNVKIDMIGNTLHKNGQYIKIDPTSIGVGGLASAGTLPNLAQLLGIGGYYLVTGVSSTVSSAGFDVEVTAMQEGLNFESNELVALEPIIKSNKDSPKTNPEDR